jgi:hypothetical protein
MLRLLRGADNVLPVNPADLGYLPDNLSVPSASTISDKAHGYEILEGFHYIALIVIVGHIEAHSCPAVSFRSRPQAVPVP